MKNHGYKSRYGAAFFSTERKDARKKEASQRNSDWRALSLLEQLTELDKRFGTGIGSIKQREKINKMIIDGNTYNPKKEKSNDKHDNQSSSRNAKSSQRATHTTREVNSGEQ